MLQRSNNLSWISSVTKEICSQLKHNETCIHCHLNGMDASVYLVYFQLSWLHHFVTITVSTSQRGVATSLSSSSTTTLMLLQETHRSCASIRLFFWLLFDFDLQPPPSGLITTFHNMASRKMIVTNTINTRCIIVRLWGRLWWNWEHSCS